MAKSFFSKLFMLITLAAWLSSCNPAPTLVPTPIPSNTPPPTKTSLPPATAIPTPTETQQSEARHIKWERVEANREAVNDYVFVDTIFDLNKDGAYFKEYGITTKEQLKQFIEDNGGYFPASNTKNSYLLFFGSKHEDLFEKTRMNMNKKLKADLDVQIVNPDQIKDTKIIGGQVHPWFIFQGQEGTAKEKCVSVAIGVVQPDSENKIVLQLVWKDGNYDLFGNKLPVPNVATPEMAKQANDLLRGMLLSGYLIGRPDEWLNHHKDIMLKDMVKENFIFNMIKEGTESQIDIEIFPPQIIQ